MAWHEPVSRTVTLCTLAFCPLIVSSLHTFPLHTRKGVRATKDTLSQPAWSQLYCPYGPLPISKPSLTSVRVSRWDPRGPL